MISASKSARPSIGALHHTSMLSTSLKISTTSWSRRKIGALSWLPATIYVPSLKDLTRPIRRRCSQVSSKAVYVPVQREMERGRLSVSEYSAHAGFGFSRHEGLPIRCVFWEERERGTSAPQQHRLDEPTKLSLSMVASLQSPLPFHLAKSLYLAWLMPPPAGGVFVFADALVPACDLATQLEGPLRGCPGLISTKAR